MTTSNHSQTKSDFLKKIEENSFNYFLLNIPDSLQIDFDIVYASFKHQPQFLFQVKSSFFKNLQDNEICILFDLLTDVSNQNVQKEFNNTSIKLSVFYSFLHSEKIQNFLSKKYGITFENNHSSKINHDFMIKNPFVFEEILAEFTAKQFKDDLIVDSSSPKKHKAKKF